MPRSLRGQRSFGYVNARAPLRPVPLAWERRSTTEANAVRMFVLELISLYALPRGKLLGQDYPLRPPDALHLNSGSNSGFDVSV
jgi:hypothetical protein